MDTTQMREIAESVYKELSQQAEYRVPKTPDHHHNGTDSIQLDPSVFLGFPVFQVADASVAPTDTPPNGTFRFYVDVTPRYRLWAYLVYRTAAGVLTRSWRVVSLT